MKLAAVTNDILGVSGRAMLEALVPGTTDPTVLADLARGKLRTKLHRLSTDPEFATMKVFRVDFDSSKELLRQWKVTHQSTLIAFKGQAQSVRT